MKKVVSREAILACSNFNEKFVMSTDAITRQLGAVITQNNMPAASCRKKLTVIQQKETVTDLESMSTAMTLREFRSILLGQDKLKCINHNNLESDLAHLASQMGIRWRLIVEEHGIKIRDLFLSVPSANSLVAQQCTTAHVLT